MLLGPVSHGLVQQGLLSEPGLAHPGTIMTSHIKSLWGLWLGHRMSDKVGARRCLWPYRGACTGMRALRCEVLSGPHDCRSSLVAGDESAVAGADRTAACPQTFMIRSRVGITRADPVTSLLLLLLLLLLLECMMSAARPCLTLKY